ncbi:tRNA (N6-threonylcarbamoyladenosine(37)-N6)-methyltransferase TrmO [Marinobacterium sediminicola]|uniref:tRNA-Thr(GGU) m(6)t(6)A37 methyltransferase TsaA n=1 Tax=Marinobacterium sediminicola TaxID=518898 RepID=A0ABY1RZS2_9GAMM|nr:tRNA (N6-threonylcarbamoyladenosine(37)-N6)-methyltransferase TrmO [Marinobacterium sediminicola]ULG69995.1 tRNA (N6-threonylcarbamoyladenosine(37)-N6)-methyltransferase TrmO [Marinobacterium sediminicola]SMR74449.1 tRNA-Thr(GGU) m(6)t(6)A37 methyltransferase TsaA [Marinobacterium sediminicola]
MSQPQFPMQAIGYIHSPFDEKFGIPRQPGLASIRAEVELVPPYANADAVRGLEHCSHIWLVFLFSATADKGWSPTVRPPRLGGNQRLGVFATRSPFRPNPIGLSCVRLIDIRCEHDSIKLDIEGADLLNGTPILDIKPYLPYSDSLPDAEFSLASKIERLQQPVVFSPSAAKSCEQLSRDLNQPLARQISEILSCDPRPAYKKEDSERVYGISLYGQNIRFRITQEQIDVISIEPNMEL